MDLHPAANMDEGYLPNIILWLLMILDLISGTRTSIITTAGIMVALLLLPVCFLFCIPLSKLLDRMRESRHAMREP